MNETFPELPGWQFEVDEVSAGVYRVVGSHSDEQTLVIEGVDPEALLMKCREQASEIVRAKASH